MDFELLPEKVLKFSSNDVSHAKFIGSIVLVVHACLWGCLSGVTSENQFNECLDCWH